MTPATRLLRMLCATALAASLVLVGGSGRQALANGVGDLYVADAHNIDEVWLLHSQIEQEIAVPPAAVPDASASASPGASAEAPTGPSQAANASTCDEPAPPADAPAPTQLSFTPDGRTLYAANGTPQLYRVRISDLCVMGPTAAPDAVVAIAHPKGTRLYAATLGSKTLSTLTDGGTGFADGPAVSATPDLLAADPREARFVAARRGQAWLAIIDPSADSPVIYPGGSGGVGGRVASAAVARDEGAVWVAMTGANPRVVRIELATGRVLNSAPLPSAPGAITAIDHAAVVALGKTLYLVQGNKARAWAPQSAPVLQLATDLTAGYVYLATADRVAALQVSNPRSSPVASVPMSDTAVSLAPVPDRASSLPAVVGSIDPGGPDATANSAAAGGGGKPGRTHAPSTDTPVTLATGARIDLGTLVAGVGALIIAVAVGSRYLIKRLAGI